MQALWSISIPFKYKQTGWCKTDQQEAFLTGMLTVTWVKSQSQLKQSSCRLILPSFHAFLIA